MIQPQPFRDPRIALLKCPLGPTGPRAPDTNHSCPTPPPPASERSYSRARELLGGDIPDGEPPWFGWFANAMPHYPQTRLLESLVCPTPGRLRQQVELPTEHPLSVEQREGITAQRLVEIVQRLLHPDA